MICPSTRILLPYGNTDLVTPIVYTSTDQNVDRRPDSDDVNIPTNKLLSTEDETCQDKSNDVTPLEPKFISTTNGMNFRKTQFNSAEESDDELSDPLPLGYRSPRESFLLLLCYTFCILLCSVMSSDYLYFIG